MARILALLLALLALILTILSFIFTVLATTSKEWASQDTFDNANAIPHSEWVTPLYTLHRSPFWVCGAANTTTVTSSGNVTGAFAITCVRYRPYGANATSCEGIVGTSINDLDARYGDSRMCQAIHMAGNLAIASSVFVGLGMLTLFALAATTLPSLLASAAESSRRRHGGHHHPRPVGPAPGVTLAKGISAATLFFLVASAAMLMLAQFYGYMGLIQDAQPNGEFALTDSLPNNVGPWVQGIASLIYASVGWLAALLAAGGVCMVWGVPNLGVGEQEYSTAEMEGGAAEKA